jgi:2-dehydro-3-deoxyphosphooctonate aldolase (KDO 8-P synthase)
MLTHKKPIVIAGPCAAESWDLILEVGQSLKVLADQLGFEYIFKASFDKANRTSLNGKRGPGLGQAKKWFADLKSKLNVPILTDIHETIQIADAAEVCDVLQIPAFLCRQTDLVTAAIQSGRSVNIKKGQFLAPHAMVHIAAKALEAQKQIPTSVPKQNQTIYLTERGVSFGYGNLVVDMRSFPMMAKANLPLLLDITHSTQLPAAGGSSGDTSSAQRSMAPVLARAATATGYLSGYFLEVHRNPKEAISDRDAQLTINQAKTLLEQLIPFWHQCSALSQIDGQFPD